MKVKEALIEVFGIKIQKESLRRWYNGTIEYIETNRYIIDTFQGNTLSTDRKILESNFQTEVIYLKHTGMVGLMAFKMKNGHIALFAFNNPLDYRTINRVNSSRKIKNYNKFVEFSKKKQHNIDNGEIDIWLSLKTMGDK
jgi:hypothetical protein